MIFFFFFFNDTATTEIYTLSLHDALPICAQYLCPALPPFASGAIAEAERIMQPHRGASICFVDRKSTRLNSSHGYISYAVFCLKKKKEQNIVYSALKDG